MCVLYVSFGFKKTLCRFGCTYFLAALVFVCVDVQVLCIVQIT